MNYNIRTASILLAEVVFRTTSILLVEKTIMDVLQNVKAVCRDVRSEAPYVRKRTTSVPLVEKSASKMLAVRYTGFTAFRFVPFRKILLTVYTFIGRLYLFTHSFGRSLSTKNVVILSVSANAKH